MFVRRFDLDFKSFASFSALVVVVLVISGLVSPLEAQEPKAPIRPVADLETALKPIDLNAGQLLNIGGQVLFAARGAQVGNELWRSDGTEEGTDWMSDLCPGICDGFPHLLAEGNGRLLLGVDDRLWISDGTDAGTVPVATPCPTCNTVFFQDAKWNGEVFLLQILKDGRWSPWVTDGTSAGTFPLDLDGRRLVSNLSPGKVTYFAASEDGADGETWLYAADGTRDGTRAVTLLCEHCGVGVDKAVELGGVTVFTTYTVEEGWKPWVTDGTAAGTRLLSDLPNVSSVSRPTHLVTVGNEAFGVYPAGCGVHCVFRTDGTTGGTRSAPELVPDGIADSRGPLELIALGNNLMGKFWNFSTGDQELWTLAGPLGKQRVLSADFIDPVGEAGGELYLHAVDNGDRSTMVTAGTEASTRKILDLEPTAAATVPGGALVVTLERLDAVNRETLLWRTDGTAEGTVRLDVQTPQSDSNPTQLQAWQGGVAWATGDRRERSVWALAAGQLRQFEVDRHLGPLVATEDRLFFYDFALRMMRAVAADGSENQLVFGGAFPLETVPWKNRMLTSVQDLGQQLWTSTGSQEATDLVVDVNPGWSSSCPITCVPSIFPRELTLVGDRLLFSAFEDAAGPGQLWATDGTLGGSSTVAEFSATGPTLAENLTPTDLVSIGSLGFFKAPDPESGLLFWVTDGTGVGTRPLTSSESQPRAVDLGVSTPWGDRLAIFERSATEPKIWWSDGGPLTLLTRLPAGSRVLSMAGDEERVYWVEDSLESGRELSWSDGRAVGKFDLFPGVRGSGVASLTPFDEGLLFAADGGDGQGFEPWMWVEGAAEPLPVADLSPGREPSSPGIGVRVGDEIFFAASDGQAGRELFAFDWTTAESRFCPQDRLCFFDGRFEVSLRWQTAGGASGDAKRAASGGDSGLFWFFDPNNWESMIKVLDGCAINGHFWVYAATSSDVGFTLRALDTKTGADRTWTHAPGSPAPAITDVEVFPCDAR